MAKISVPRNDAATDTKAQKDKRKYRPRDHESDELLRRWRIWEWGASLAAHSGFVADLADCRRYYATIKEMIEAQAPMPEDWRSPARRDEAQRGFVLQSRAINGGVQWLFGRYQNVWLAAPRVPPGRIWEVLRDAIALPETTAADDWLTRVADLAISETLAKAAERKVRPEPVRFAPAFTAAGGRIVYDIWGFAGAGGGLIGQSWPAYASITDPVVPQCWKDALTKKDFEDAGKEYGRRLYRLAKPFLLPASGTAAKGHPACGPAWHVLLYQRWMTNPVKFKGAEDLFERIVRERRDLGATWDDYSRDINKLDAQAIAGMLASTTTLDRFPSNPPLTGRPGSTATGQTTLCLYKNECRKDKPGRGILMEVLVAEVLAGSQDCLIQDTKDALHIYAPMPNVPTSLAAYIESPE